MGNPLGLIRKQTKNVFLLPLSRSLIVPTFQNVIFVDCGSRREISLTSAAFSSLLLRLCNSGPEEKFLRATIWISLRSRFYRSDFHRLPTWPAVAPSRSPSRFLFPLVRPVDETILFNFHRKGTPGYYYDYTRLHLGT